MPPELTSPHRRCFRLLEGSGNALIMLWYCQYQGEYLRSCADTDLQNRSEAFGNPISGNTHPEAPSFSNRTLTRVEHHSGCTCVASDRSFATVCSQTSATAIATHSGPPAFIFPVVTAPSNIPINNSLLRFH
jgi:hypothetical protein